MRAGEVIAKLVEDTYFMRVDNRVTQVPPLRTQALALGCGFMRKNFRNNTQWGLMGQGGVASVVWLE
jgi:hypothetical protein